jgi:hypothetical protein
MVSCNQRPLISVKARKSEMSSEGLLKRGAFSRRWLGGGGVARMALEIFNYVRSIYKIAGTKGSPSHCNQEHSLLSLCSRGGNFKQERGPAGFWMSRWEHSCTEVWFGKRLTVKVENFDLFTDS